MGTETETSQEEERLRQKGTGKEGDGDRTKEGWGWEGRGGERWGEKETKTGKRLSVMVRKGQEQRVGFPPPV